MVYVDDLAIVCVVAEVPMVGDRIHGDLPAIVDKVCVNRDGHVRIYATRPPTSPDATGQADPSVYPTGNDSIRVAGVLAELRRRRLARDNVAARRTSRKAPDRGVQTSSVQSVRTSGSYRIVTGVPSGISRSSRRMSVFRNRMQPCEIRPGISEGRFVP